MTTTHSDSPVLRKVLHVGFGLGAFALRWLTPLQVVILLAAALVFNLFLLDRLFGGRLMRPAERQREFPWNKLGLALYPAVLLVVVLVFRDRMELAAAVWALLAFGDGMAGLCGMLLGGPTLPWNRDKTWAGLAAFVLYGASTAAFVLRFVQQAVLDGSLSGRGPIHWIGLSFLNDHNELAWLLATSFAAATIAGLVESLDIAIDDNLTVPLVGGAILWAGVLVAG